MHEYETSSLFFYFGFIAWISQRDCIISFCRLHPLENIKHFKTLFLHSIFAYYSNPINLKDQAFHFQPIHWIYSTWCWCSNLHDFESTKLFSSCECQWLYVILMPINWRNLMLHWKASKVFRKATIMIFKNQKQFFT